jgi:hypothetical protein
MTRALRTAPTAIRAVKSSSKAAKRRPNHSARARSVVHENPCSPAKVRKLKVKKVRGATFLTVKVTKLRKGKLKFKVRAKKLGTPGGAKLITQAVRSKRK